MSDFFDRISKLSQKQLMLLALDLQDQIDAFETRGHEPVAIVGMGCRLPGGADDPEGYWRLLDEGRDAIRSVPADRWDADALFDPDPDAPGTISVRTGGFLDDVSGFDPGFFGIAQREAQTMDPQQRLLLEVAWEALEDAGIAPPSLAGTQAGVFIGLCNTDYFQRVLDLGTERIDAYLASGSAPSVAAGRIAYCLGLQGPAMTLDTACSSSLVALHLAVKSLRNGECRVALAGGVNVMCTPETTVALTKAHMLAPDGRCKTFDAAADGFARGEGCGVLVLKRLADAQADGDRVLAVIRGSATNQDGRSGGLTVPNGPQQEAVIRAALADAGLAPDEIDYVEAHGTGTSLGDPIEVRALAGALGPGRAADRPLLIGSAKTNLGHLESAAGVAGVIKVVLALGHGRIPRHLHFREPSPHIAWDDYPVRVTAGATDWARGERPRRAGVSSFGFSGSNAHVVIEEAPAEAAIPAPPARTHHILPLSARSASALRSFATKYRDLLAAADLAAVARAAGNGRSHFGHRLAIVADSVETARAALAAAASGKAHPALWTGESAPGAAPEVAFMFTGQGSQYPGMAKALYETVSAFRDVVDRCDRLIGADAEGLRLTDVLWGGGTAIHETVWAQPALFAVEVAAAEMWRRFGVEPAAVIGHSLGEYAAACVAGVFSLEEGLALVAERGRIMQALPSAGAMTAFFAPLADVEAAISPFGGRLAVAAINTADNVVVAGEPAAMEALVASLADQQIEAHRLRISVAAHSPLVEPGLDALEAAARKVAMHAPSVPVAWNGGGLDQTTPDALYWRRHLREPVRFAGGLAALHAGGYRTFLEVGPHPTLAAFASRSFDGGGLRLLPSLRRDRDEWEILGTSIAQLYVQGAAIDWSEVAVPAAPVRLPTYPFERKRYWIEQADARTPVVPRRRAGVASWLPGRRLATATPIFETQLFPDRPGWLGDHRVAGRVIAPGPLFLAMALAGAREALGPDLGAVVDFAISAPLPVPDEGRIVQLHLGARAGGEAAFTVSSRAADGDEWTMHASGRLVASGHPGNDVGAPGALAEAFGAEEGAEPFYERLAQLGADFGAAFRTIRAGHRREGEALVRVARPDVVHESDAFAVLVDGALQAIGLALPDAPDDGVLHLLTGIERVDLPESLPDLLWCHVRLRESRAGSHLADVTLTGDDGAALGLIAGAMLTRSRGAADDGLCYETRWEQVADATPAAPSLASPETFKGDVRASFPAVAADHGMDIYETLLPTLDRLATGHVAAALRQLGFDDAPGRSFAEQGEAERLGIAPRHRELFGRLLAILAEDGVVSREDGGWQVRAALPPETADEMYDPLLARFGAVTGELRALRRCGTALGAVLTGRQDPVQLLFPGGELAEARAIYVDSPYAQTYNRALVEALRHAIAGLPRDRKLRILEIGAGTGGTTTFVLPELEGREIDYVFTDLSPLFLDRATERFGERSGFRTAILDIERDPLEQGFPAGGFDIVIAANVLHATADLARTVAHAHALLAPDGLLFLLEGVAPERWVDVTFGLTEGWWRFNDRGLRPAYPLVSRDTWLDLLGREGFAEAFATPDGGEPSRGQAQQALIVARRVRTPRCWTLVDAPDLLGDALATRLESRGDEVVRVAMDGDQPIRGDLVYLGALPLAAQARDDLDAAAACEERAVQAPLRALAAIGEGRAWLVTEGAQPVDRAMSAGARWQAPLLGLGRVFALERPDRWGGMLDLPPGSDADEQARLIVVALDAADGEDQVAVRNGVRFAARLGARPAPAAAAPVLHHDGTYLVTGGFGGLGPHVGAWLAERGAGCVALMGRNPDPDAPEVAAIRALGAVVLPIGADVADAAAIQALASRCADEGRPLKGIVHAAADLSIAPIAELTPAQVSAMLRPKLQGTLALEQVAARFDLDFLVLFSSTTAILGAAGFAHYAAANAFVDATAQTADETGCRTLAVDWGTWEVMRNVSAKDRASYRASGLEPVGTAEALDLMGRLIESGERQAMVARVDWAVLKPLHEARGSRPLLTAFGHAAPQTGAAGADLPEEAAWPARLAGLPTAMRDEAMIDLVRATVAATLSEEPRDVGLDTGLFEMGMDSLMSIDLKRRLEQGAGRSLPATLTFNYPNVRALAGFLGRMLAVQPAPVQEAAEAEPIVSGNIAIDDLSDDDLEARLLARLGEVE